MVLYKNEKIQKILIFIWLKIFDWLDILEGEDKEESSIIESLLFIDLEKKQLIGEIG